MSIPAASTVPWSAPRAGAPVCSEASVPASKSLTNRYLLLAGLAAGPSTVVNPLDSRDSRLMLTALERLGSTVEHLTVGDEPAVRVGPITIATESTALDPVEIYCGLAGTVMRFVPAAAALTGRRVFFDGDPEARVRPMAAVLEGLRSLGVTVTEHGEPGFLPFTVASSGGVEGGTVTIDASASSQFVSGLLLAAPRFNRGVRLTHSGTQVPSLEHVEMTLKVLADLRTHPTPAASGVYSPEPYTWVVEPGEIPAFEVRVEPDLSNAGPFLCAAAVTGGEVSMPGWPLTSTQIGRRWPQLLAEFGCQVDLTATSATTGTLTVRGPQTLVSPGVVDGTAELTPTVAALAAVAQGETTFTSVQHLRGHETDRIAALVTEINRLGGAAEETEDGFRVTSGVRHGGLVRAYADHRMATFGAILGLVLDGVEVDDIATTAKTMPDFPDRWQRLLRP